MKANIFIAILMLSLSSIAGAATTPQGYCKSLNDASTTNPKTSCEILDIQTGGIGTVVKDIQYTNMGRQEANVGGYSSGYLVKYCKNGNLLFHVSQNLIVQDPSLLPYSIKNYVINNASCKYLPENTGPVQLSQ